MVYLILIFGIWCCSTSVIFIKESSVDPIALSAYRLILGSLFLLPLFYLATKRKTCPPLKTLLKLTWAPAIFLAIHFISWIFGARLTPSANASLLVNMVPAVMPFLLWGVLGERLHRGELIGTTIALSGIVLMGIFDFNLSPEYATGDVVCFLSMLFYAGYLIYARKNKAITSIYFYVVPVYLIAGIICLVTAVILELAGQPISWAGLHGTREWIPVLGLAIIPTVFGHSIINRSLKIIRGQAVVILNLSQFIFAGFMGYFLLNEIPHASFYATSTLVIAGAIIAIRNSPKI